MTGRLLPLLVLLAACGDKAPADSDPPAGGDDSGADTDSDDTGPLDDCADEPNVTWDGWAEGFFRSYCGACHSAASPQRYGAPEDLNFDTLAEVQAQAALIRWSVLEQGSMPVGGGVTEEAEILLDVFLRCALDAR